MIVKDPPVLSNQDDIHTNSCLVLFSIFTHYDRRADWTNSRGTKIASTVAGVLIGVFVFIAVCVALTFLSCYCGWWAACGYGRKNTTAYQNVESQPIATSGASQPYSDEKTGLNQK
ncbi:hypothetical protein BLNAU_13370 [Blattamonas nauphoetae]|uniref:Uncharacterized protein n=1 Tax=Blattamonas nauphoetae TaxID=2049346 RepID=A0ABQ9XHY2_9EUKA|nr:hypothetical protein BLNAU_13370 [Blattamonas nauphoetae]